MKSVFYFSPILKKFKFFRQTSVKIPNKKLHETLSSGGLCSLVSEGRTDILKNDSQT